MHTAVLTRVPVYSLLTSLSCSCQTGHSVPSKYLIKTDVLATAQVPSGLRVLCCATRRAVSNGYTALWPLGLRGR